jgi:hypothetical protein
MRFRLVVYDTWSDNKFDAERRYEILGDRNAIWFMWFNLTHDLKYKHVEVFHINGVQQHPEKGIAGMEDYNL